MNAKKNNAKLVFDFIEIIKGKKIVTLASTKCEIFETFIDENGIWENSKELFDMILAFGEAGIIVRQFLELRDSSSKIPFKKMHGGFWDCNDLLVFSPEEVRHACRDNTPEYFKFLIFGDEDEPRRV